MLAGRSTFRDDLARQTIQTQVNAHTAVNTLPTGPPDPTIWRSPYARDPATTGSMPAIFTHLRWASGSQFPEAPVNPPIFPETFAAISGTPL